MKSIKVKLQIETEETKKMKNKIQKYDEEIKKLAEFSGGCTNRLSEVMKKKAASASASAAADDDDSDKNKLKKAELSLRTVMYLSFWGPNS